MGKSSKKKKRQYKERAASEDHVVHSANSSELITEGNTALATSQSNQAAIPSSENNNEDRISQLPINVLCHILSFLPTRCAVATSILSQKWMYVWVDIPVLDFTDLPSSMTDMDAIVFNQEQYDNFANFMNRVLLLNSAPYIRRLHFETYDGFVASHIYEWMMVIARLCIGELCCFAKNFQVLIPPYFVISKDQLVVLKLQGFGLVLPSSFHLPRLQSFSLIEGNLSNEDDTLNVDPWMHFLSKCPVLEELNIVNCKRIEKLSVCSSSIKILRVALNNAPKRAILIQTPNLEIVDLSIGIKRSKVNDLSSLVKARLDIWTSSVRWVKLLEKISNTKSLVLHQITMDGSSAYMRLPNFQNLTHLEVGFTAWPIWMFHWPDKKPRKIKLPLKRIEYCGFDVVKGIKVVQYFLENSALLKEFKIYTHRWLDSETEITILKKLLKLWRASTQCRITVVNEGSDSMSEDSDSESEGPVDNDSESKGPAETLAAEALLDIT
ncbi:hypothetical protein RDABS01_032075, partial [Bienertia sinuspersici]